MVGNALLLLSLDCVFTSLEHFYSACNGLSDSSAAFVACVVCFILISIYTTGHIIHMYNITYVYTTDPGFLFHYKAFDQLHEYVVTK